MPPAPAPSPGRAGRRPKAGAAAPLALAALALAAACGGDASGEGPATTAQFLNQYEATLCDAVDACCDARGVGHDRAACADAVRATFPPALLDQANYAYDRAGAAACLRALAALPPACAPFNEGAFGEGSDFGRACGRVFAPRGTALPGEYCAATWQCAPSAEPDALVSCPLRDRAAGGFERACEVRAYADEGEPCDEGPAARGDARGGVVRLCKPGPLYCAGDGTCRAPAAQGQPCEANASGACAGGTFCGAPGLCEAQRGAGAPCDDAPDACEGASFCDRQARTCAPRRPQGEPCSASECQGACVGGVCSAPLPDRRDDVSNLCRHAL